MNRTLFPRMKQSPYVAVISPSRPYSLVCSIAMFKKPSRLASTPLYVIPLLSFTTAGRPSTDFRKSDGDRLFFVDAVVFDSSPAGSGSSSSAAPVVGSVSAMVDCGMLNNFCCCCVCRLDGVFWFCVGCWCLLLLLV
jgi:hypothetical protein